MKFIANIFWFFLTGLETALLYFILGLVWCITIVGIPFGKQCFKMAGLVLCPFGKRVNSNFGKHPFANIIWFIFGGFSLVISYFVLGLVWCITVVGIPLGKQCFKFAKLSACPFGATVK